MISYVFRYMGFFQDGGFSFEKSATYFDKDAAPKQASLLVPAAKIIIMLLDPIDRALSWYYVSDFRHWLKTVGVF